MKIILASHGHLASGIKSALDILLGKSDNVIAIDAYIDKRNFEDDLEKCLDELKKEEQIVMLSDLYEGSVNQNMFRHLVDAKLILVTGINLKTVIKLAMYEGNITVEELDEIIEQGKQGMMRISLDESEDSDDDFY